jgi:hypothetical protein
LLVWRLQCSLTTHPHHTAALYRIWESTTKVAWSWKMRWRWTHGVRWGLRCLCPWPCRNSFIAHPQVDGASQRPISTLRCTTNGLEDGACIRRTPRPNCQCTGSQGGAQPMSVPVTLANHWQRCLSPAPRRDPAPPSSPRPHALSAPILRSLSWLLQRHSRVVVQELGLVIQD